MNLPVTITGSGRNEFKGTIYDISPDSAQILYHVSDGINLFPEKETSIKDIKSLQCILHFDLAYGKTVYHVKLQAYPVYLRTVHKDTLAAGMVFSQDDPVENKKVSNFLQYQLEKSFSELEQQKKNKAAADKNTIAKNSARTIKSKNEPHHPEVETIIPVELEELILTTNYSKKDLEIFKQLLIHVMSSLKVIMELTRHINEKINMIEHKISRRT
jgi:hypothetical protein